MTESEILTDRTVPELRIYSVFDRPVGPHPVGMFEAGLVQYQQRNT